ncbi:alcohol dehydrogenase class-3-like protein [Dinothrombium tinctorium]|uniref:Alcohol dehydrogenase class-3-like protein n=1 Tax=Dinothrombium tinctorium TaxID=1965070 RepID=A0A443QTM3_9ACAR|nr:alcohol dehydrogenase class-3-like protein [Dinothrombium tinctorium]
MSAASDAQTIRCRAAICWAPNQAITVEEVEVDPPKAGEVRIKVLANGICHTDLHLYTGHTTGSEVKYEYPCILGHEATGIVESVGDGVTSVAVGDHVMSLFNGQCRECIYCKNPNTNLCLKRSFDEPRMSDGTARFRFNGKPVYHFLGISSLSEYTVISEIQVAKIDPKSRMDRACIFSCGFTTGYGSAVNVAKINSGSAVAVWGMGAVGLAAVYGACKAGANIIIGVDTNDSKITIAKQIGCTHFVNPLKCEEDGKSTVDVIKQITNGLGLDFALECVGHIKPIEDAIESIAPWGTVVAVGVYPGNKNLEISPNTFLTGKKLTGALFGGYKSRDCIPLLVDEYNRGEIDVEPFFTGNIKLEEVDDAFQKLLKVKALRTVVLF